MHFRLFCRRLTKRFVFPESFDDEELNRLYIDYKESLININEVWLKENKNNILKDWIEEYFQEWNLHEHSNMLKTQFKKKVKEFKKNFHYPKVIIKELMTLSQEEIISSYEDIIEKLENRKQ